jgi:EAL domain-containing protein (putative c-di-GMP-specific phosphodiesterase class I)
VVVELTEHRPVADYPTLVAAVAELRLGDAKLAVDDAGAGYAGLQHLMLLRPTWSSWTGRWSPAATATRPRRP